MRYFLIALLICLAASTYAQDDNCEKPKVAVVFEGIHNPDQLFQHLNSQQAFQTIEQWKTDIQKWTLDELQQRSPDVIFLTSGSVSLNDGGYYFSYSLRLWSIGERLEVPGMPGVYMYGPELGYLMVSELGSHPACGSDTRILEIEFVQEEEIFRAITQNVAKFGDIGDRIKQQEESHLVPPRGPELASSQDENYVSPLKDKRELHIKVDVTNCKGEAVFDKDHGQKVFLPKETDRGENKPTKYFDQGSDATGSDLVLKIQRPHGGMATYKLLRGIEADKEKIELKTCGLDKESLRTEEISIYGLEIKVKPDRKEIYTNERTEIVLTFNETSPDGKKNPVAGKDLQVKVTGLEDGKVSAKNGYTTNDKGEVTMLYKAGNDDRNINITASYQPEDYPDKAEGKATISVKPLEFDATILLKKKIEHRIVYELERSWSDDFCANTTTSDRKYNEVIDASIYLTLKLVESTDMPMYNQTWEHYEPLNVNLSTFSVSSKDKKVDYHNSTGYECASGGNETTVRIDKRVGKKEIEGQEVIGAIPWIIAFDNETGKAVKIMPAGYSVAYEFEETNSYHSISWSGDDDEEDSDSETKTRNARFAVGPVEDPVPDPTAKSSSNWLKDYIEKEMGEELPFDISQMIPDMDPREVQNDINPDVVVSFGDGKGYFGGSGHKLTKKQIDGGFEQVDETYNWQMTRKKRN
ncbi:MAG: hypothetical protein GY751_17240 [Bacteroidetes bacterium]|nr:hypothetical protein [Bacteroidota bacterium]